MLNGKLIERICIAFTDAFTLDDLRLLVRSELNEQLDVIVATNRPLSGVVLDLADWADANDLLLSLLSAAAAKRPHNRTLGQLAAEAATIQFTRAARGELRRIDFGKRLLAPIYERTEVETTLVTWLVNRSQQMYELTKIIERVLSMSAQRPIVCLLYGSDEECHEKFVQRVAQHQLKRLIPERVLDIPQHFLLDLPTRGYREPADLHDFLRANLGTNAFAGAKATVVDINSCFAGLRAPVVIQTMLSVDTWSPLQHKTVYDYLCFWNEWPALGAQQWLLVFLCIRCRAKTKGLLSFLHRKQKDTTLDGALAQFTALDDVQMGHMGLSQIVCKPLPPLEPISREDAERWASDPEVQQVFAGRDLVSEVRSLYVAKRVSAVPMATLHEMLAGALKLPIQGVGGETT